jgi:5-methylcytosine-specific restriction endonuclease McrA
MTSEQLRKRQVSDANYRQKHPKRVKSSAKQSRDKLKREVIAHYGGHCACCGEQNIAFLTIDHINNDGKSDRIQLLGSNKGGCGFYSKIRQMGYPPGYQVLCWNCNHAKAIYGTCPHQVQDSTSLSTGQVILF